MGSKKRILSLLLTVVMVLSFVVSCKGVESKERIVCLAPSMVEVCYALGLGDDIVGWSQYTDYPPAVEDREGWVPYAEYEFVNIEEELKKDVAVVSGFTEYNAELVKALEPTLILVESDLQYEMYEELKAEGYNVQFHSPKSLEDVYTMMVEIGEAAGKKGVAEDLVAGYKKDVEDIRKITSELPPVKVYFEIAHQSEFDGEKFGPFGAGTGSPLDQVIEIAGGKNVLSDVEGGYIDLEFEDIVEYNPDVILSPMWPNALDYEITTVREIMTREGFEEVSAVKTSRVYFYDSSLFKRYGPRTITSIKKLAYLLHPYYFENPKDSVSPWELGKIDVLYQPEKSLD